MFVILGRLSKGVSDSKTNNSLYSWNIHLTMSDNVKAPRMMMMVHSVEMMAGNYLFSFDSVFTGIRVL